MLLGASDCGQTSLLNHFVSFKIIHLDTFCLSCLNGFVEGLFIGETGKAIQYHVQSNTQYHRTELKIHYAAVN